MADPKLTMLIQMKDKTKRGFAGLRKTIFSLKGALAGLGGALVVRGIWKSIKATMTLGDQLAKAAQRAGLTTKQFSELEYAAAMSGVGMEALAASLRRFQRMIAAAKEGVTTAQEAFDGISYQGKDLTDVLLNAADAFSTMEDAEKKTAAAFALFGIPGTKLIPLLNEGRAGIERLIAEAHRLNAVWSDEGGKASEQFGDALERVWRAVDGLKREVVVALAGPMTDLMSDMAEWIGALNEERIKQFGEEVANTMTQLASAVNDAAKAIAWFTKMYDKIKTPPEEAPWSYGQRRAAAKALAAAGSFEAGPLQAGTIPQLASLWVPPATRERPPGLAGPTGRMPEDLAGRRGWEQERPMPSIAETQAQMQESRDVLRELTAIIEDQGPGAMLKKDIPAAFKVLDDSTKEFRNTFVDEMSEAARSAQWAMQSFFFDAMTGQFRTAEDALRRFAQLAMETFAQLAAQRMAASLFAPGGSGPMKLGASPASLAGLVVDQIQKNPALMAGVKS